jgi:hypothetical protein
MCSHASEARPRRPRPRVSAAGQAGRPDRSPGRHLRHPLHGEHRGRRVDRGHPQPPGLRRHPIRRVVHGRDSHRPRPMPVGTVPPSHGLRPHVFAAQRRVSGAQASHLVTRMRAVARVSVVSCPNPRSSAPLAPPPELVVSATSSTTPTRARAPSHRRPARCRTPGRRADQKINEPYGSAHPRWEESRPYALSGHRENAKGARRDRSALTRHAPA